MEYNIHPIIVHFPIAFLFLYSIIKILPLSKWFPGVAWKQIERLLLVVGVLGSFAAYATGDQAKDLFAPNHDLVEAHEAFASITVWLFGLLLLGDALSIINLRAGSFLQKYPALHKVAGFVEKVLTNRAVSLIIVIGGIVALTVTGLLGGVMVYGLGADPLAEPVLKLLGIDANFR